MMSRGAAVAFALVLGAASLLLPACTTGAQVYREEWPQAAANCELPGATLEPVEGRRRTVQLIVPPGVERTEGRIACAAHWARERGLNLVEPPVSRLVTQYEMAY
ncbi:MAG TPA: hypothetical protein VN231_09695 [Allosphingosinicella sp.]|nr:hypothetical protein [Allosphingosinicella sp.]